MAEDRRQISELPVVSATVADDDLLVKRNTGTGEDEQLPMLVFKQEYFGSVVDYDVGVGDGEVPALEIDEDYQVALPAVSAKNLTNFPAGMNVGELAINVEIEVSGSPFGNGLQFGINDVPNIVIVDFSTGPSAAGLLLTDQTSLEGQVYGIMWTYTGGVTAAVISAHQVNISGEDQVLVDTPLLDFDGDANDEVMILFPSSGTGVNTGGAKVHNIRNFNYKPIDGNIAFNVLDFEFAKVVQLTLTEDVTITGFDNLQETPAGAVEDHTEFLLIVIQDYPGGWNVQNWPAEVVWIQGAPPDLSTMDDGEKRFVYFYHDQTTMYGWYPPTPAEVKTFYESNDDTNAFTDDEKSKLGLIEVSAPVNIDALLDIIGQGSLFLTGNWDASVGTFPFDEYLYGGYPAGAVFIVTVGGTVDGVTFNAGDMLIALVDDPLDDTYAGNWNRILGNDSGGGAVSGTYQGAATGGTSSPNIDINYTLSGGIVTLSIENFTFVSNSTQFGIAGTNMPAAIRPSTNVAETSPFVARNNSTQVIAFAGINTDGSIIFRNNFSGGGWTASGVKGIGTNSTTATLVYSLNPIAAVDL